jgi:hypothetical protein
VDTSVILWIAAAVASLVAEALSFVNHDKILEKVSQDLHLSLDLSRSYVPNTNTAVATIVMTVIWLAVVTAMRSGKSWARLLLTVLGILSLLGIVLTGFFIQYVFAAGALGVVQAIAHILTLLAVIGAIYFQYRGEANRYFQSFREAR